MQFDFSRRELEKDMQVSSGETAKFIRSHFGEASVKVMLMFEIAIVIIVLGMNMLSALCYSKEKKRTGLILKALADGISLIFVCTR